MSTLKQKFILETLIKMVNGNQIKEDNNKIRHTLYVVH